MRRAALLLTILLGGCPNKSGDSSAPAASSSTTTSSVPSASSSATPPSEEGAPVAREGGALARSPDASALWIADEDHGVVRRVSIEAAIATPPPLPPPAKEPYVIVPGVDRPGPAEKALDVSVKSVAFTVPGRPANLIVEGDRVLVTVRDPGLLLALGPDGHELFRVAIPADAWGLALASDRKTAFVTSAWTHQVTAIDLDAKKVRWSANVEREPRAVVALADGSAVYVTHLVGAALTKITELGAEAPKVARVAFEVDPERTQLDTQTPTASLAYAATLGPNGRRLFVPRHALGSKTTWSGVPTLDVLVVPEDTSLAPRREGPPLGTRTLEDLKLASIWAGDRAGVIVDDWTTSWDAPRAIAYRKKLDTILVASESHATLAELDALSIAPGLRPLRVYDVGALPPKGAQEIKLPPRCGAPTGVALSQDESVAWVFCRTTNNLVAVRLEPNGEADKGVWREVQEPPPWGPFAYAKLADDPDMGDPKAALGRRLFFDAREPDVSGSMSCSSCHPEGRDDGFVWREVTAARFSNRPLFHATVATLGERDLISEKPGAKNGFARQTPMLAGRVNANGPYGWKGESPDVIARIKAGFGLHGGQDADGKSQRDRAEPLAIYLRKGLVAPPIEARELSDQEKRGKDVFESAATRCATCHAPKTEYTDRTVDPVPFPALPGFDDEVDHTYKVPSLKYVGSTAPYMHDGRFATLEELIEKNQDRMGKTSKLSADERAALIAFLRTL